MMNADPIEELAEVLCNMFECEDALRELNKALLIANNSPVRLRVKKSVVTWLQHLATAHEDIDDLLLFPHLSESLQRSRRA